MALIDADLRSTLIAQDEILYQLANMLFSDAEERASFAQQVKDRINLGVGLEPSNPLIADLGRNDQKNVLGGAQGKVEAFWAKVREGWPDLAGESWGAR